MDNSYSNVKSRITSIRNAFLLGLGLLLISQTSLSAQITAAVFNSPSTHKEPVVSVHFKHEPLTKVLHTLARKVNVGISYETEIVPPKRVTYRASKKSIFKILDDVLKDTGLYSTLSHNRKVIMIKKKPLIPAIRQETITGTVTDAGTGNTLPGANIRVKGTSTGTSTGSDGQYSLTVESLQDTLIVTFIGYQTKQVPINGRTNITVALQSSAVGLSEMVVTGTGGPVKRESVGHTISTKRFDKIEDISSNTVEDALSGKVAGVSIKQESGNVEQASRIRIRGTSSLSQTNQPLIYVDGVRVTGTGGFAPGVASGGLGAPSGLANIDFDAIERVEILKGPAAATLYGSQASAGVIQIFTKKGSRETPPQFSFELTNTFYQMPNRFKANTGFVENTEEQKNVRDILGLNVDLYEPFVSPVQLIDLYSIGVGQDFSGSVSGGANEITYFANLRYNRSDGPFDPSSSNFNGGAVGKTNDKRKKLYFSGNLNFIPNDKFNIRVQTGYTNSDANVYGSGVTIYTPTSTARYAKPERVGQVSQYDTFGIPFFATPREGSYPQIGDVTDQGRVIVQTNYLLTDEISIDAHLGVDYRDQRSQRFEPFGYAVDGVAPGPDGSTTIANRQQTKWSFSGKSNWTKDFTKNVHSNFVVGLQYYNDKTNSTSSTGRSFSGPGLEVLNATATQTSISQFIQEKNLGAFAQDQISYGEWIYLTGGIRLDASSAFGSNFNYAAYPKVSLSFLPTRAFDLNIPLVSSFRVRGALGQSGQQPGAFDRFTTYLPVNSPEGSGLIPGNLGNEDLKPEVSTEWEVGFDLGLLQERFSLNATYWNRTTEDALINRTFAPSGGFTVPQLTNLGKLAAQGVELTLDANVIQRSKFDLNVFANAAYLHEKVLSLGGAPPIKVDATYIRNRMFIKEGYAPAAYFGTKFPKGVAFPFDANQDGKPDSRAELEDYFSSPVDPSKFTSAVMVAGPQGDALTGGSSYLDHYLGKPTPDWEGSFGLSTNLFGNLTLSTRFKYATGNFYHHNLTDAFRRANAGIGRNYMRSTQLEAILKNPASTTAERIEAGKNWVNNMVALSPFDGLNEVEKADYVRWSNLSISYRLPTKFLARFGIDRASFTASGNNLALWTKYGGVDPTATGTGSLGQGATLGENFGGGLDVYGTPLLRSYSLTLNVSL